MELFILLGIGLLIFYSLSRSSSKTKKIVYTDSDGSKKAEKLEPRRPNNILSIEKPQDIILNEDAKKILDLFENTKSNVFMTGKAGTGKSTLLKYFRATTKKNLAVVAPTGIAAINVNGQTIHSFFGFGIDITPSRVRYLNPQKLRIIRNLQTLIIDEISMVRADLLDCVDKSLKLNRRNDLPFGGVQIIAIGDPYQLPPVVKTSEKKFFDQVYGGAHFFNSKSFKSANFKIRELTEVHRQKDEKFKNILNAIRNGTHTDIEINLLNSSVSDNISSTDSVKLVTTNALAKMINEEEMKKLVGDEKIYRAHVTGEFKEKDMPTEVELMLKEGAMVMLLNNDRDKRWVNGDTAKIISIEENSIRVKFFDNTYAQIDPNEWNNIKFIYNEQEGKIEPEIIGKFIQLPVKPAWAITIHKSQGQTYPSVHIDFGSGTFAPGQAYVALSRCTSLEGLSLETPLMIHDIVVDEKVKSFMGHSDPPENSKRDETKNQPIIANQNSEVTKSDINKLMSFIENPLKYAINTEKAKKKVAYVLDVYERGKDTFDEGMINRFNNSIIIYNKRMKN